MCDISGASSISIAVELPSAIMIAGLRVGAALVGRAPTLAWRASTGGEGDGDKSLDFHRDKISDFHTIPSTDMQLDVVNSKGLVAGVLI